AGIGHHPADPAPTAAFARLRLVRPVRDRSPDLPFMLPGDVRRNIRLAVVMPAVWTDRPRTGQPLRGTVLTRPPLAQTGATDATTETVDLRVLLGERMPVLAMGFHCISP